MDISVKTWRLCLFAYLLLFFVFVVVKFNGDVGALADRAASISRAREEGRWNYNLKPLGVTAHYFRNISSSYAYTNILGNVVPFMPFGVLFPLAARRPVGFWGVLLRCLALIVAVEAFQFITMLGFFDIDDVWLNLSGCAAGYAAYLLLTKISGAGGGRARRYPQKNRGN